MTDKCVVIAISGASGALYGVRLIRALAQSDVKVLVILSDSGLKVLAHEMGYDPGQSFVEFLASCHIKFKKPSQIEVFFQNEIAAAPASGSFVHAGMVVSPCSMKTLSAIAAGFADNLITRSADVSLKEERPLILVPRETPYSLIHLENMIRAKKAGAVILPPNPAFYHHPQTIEELVDTTIARILDHLKIPHQLTLRWGDPAP